MKIQKFFISLPADEDHSPGLRERISVYVLVLIPWTLVYELFVALGIPPDAVIAYLPFEQHIPIIEWTEVVYAATYIFVTLVPLVAATSRILREFSITALFSIVVMSLLFIIFPFIAPPREFVPQGFLGRLLLFERNYDTAAAAFPSYHVVWAIISARALAQSFPHKKLLWWLIALLITVSCITTSMHALVDVVAGAVMGFLFLHYKPIWAWIRSLTERIANSRREKIIGPVRIINIGIYTGLAGGIGILICGTLLGSGNICNILLIAFSALIMAGLWGYIFGIFSAPLRAYGYYGSVIGVFLGVLLARLYGGSMWLLLAAFAVAGPAVQVIGRLSCLVQGCCYGHEAPPSIGIRYQHPHSQVCRSTNLAGVPLHPTPLYSILWNMILAIILGRLWSLHVDTTLIAGLYLILSGLGRFIEEFFRGDPQIFVLSKFRLNQLMAIISVIAGALIMIANSGQKPPEPNFNFLTVIVAILFGLITFFTMGIDFPNSTRPFARVSDK